MQLNVFSTPNAAQISVAGIFLTLATAGTTTSVSLVLTIIRVMPKVAK